MMNNVKFPTDLETVALLNFVEGADGVLRTDSPNGGFLIEVEGDELRFIPYGGGYRAAEKYRLVQV